MTPILEAFFSAPPTLRGDSLRTAARRAGISYEKRVHAALEEVFGDSYRRAPWIQFLDSRGRRWCQPDAIVVNNDLFEPSATIFEIKVRATVLAWWQLRRLYEPVVRHLLGEKFRIRVAMVTRFYDPDVKFPEDVHVTSDIRDVPRCDAFVVYLMKG